MWLGCKTFTCVGSASAPDGGLAATTRCNRLDAGVVTLTIVLSCVINILLLHIRVLLGIACVCFFSISVSCVHSREYSEHYVWSLSLSSLPLSPPVSSTSYLRGVVRCYDGRYQRPKELGT